MSIRRTLSAATALTVAGLVVALPSAAEADVTVGFSTTATATPVRIEIYSPTIPIPSEPQAELNLAYTIVEGSGSPTSGQNAHGRSSWIWPGDAVGEGAKTFGDQVPNLPDSIRALYAGGYPVQSNSYYPGDPNTASDNSVPGAVQTTTAGTDKIVAKVGYSPDGDVQDSGSPSPSPTASPTGGLGSLTNALPLSSLLGTDGSAPADGPVPPELAALVDFGGSSSVSRSTYSDGTITAYANSRMHDVSLLGGLITMDSLSVTASVDSTLAGAEPKVDAHFVGLSVAGQQFKVTKDGVEAAGQSTPAFPGLPADPGQALKALGVTFALPTGEKSVDGSNGSVTVKGLKMTVDVTVLHAYLDQLPLNDLADQVPEIPGWPEDQGLPQLRTLVQTLVNFKPRIVFYLGNASATAVAVPPIQIDPCLLGLPSCTSGGIDSALPPVSSSGFDNTTPLSTGDLSGVDTVPVVQTPQQPAIQNAAAGLPPLKSVPTMLVLAGLLAASGLGWWMQRIGSMMLGAAGACAHGAETGIPDLRKV